MSHENVIDELQRLGMSGYEAKSYVALVAAGTPLNGYEVAKRSGVPRSTVYETLGKLVGRGAAFEVRADEASVGYLSLPPAALLDRMRRDFDRSVDVLRTALSEATAPQRGRLLHGLTDRTSFLARAEDVIVAARQSVIVSGWPTEIGPLKPLLQRAEADGVAVSVTTLGPDPDPDPVGHTISHRYARPEADQDLGSRLLVVAADGEQAVIGGVTDEVVSGLYTDDPHVVLVAVAYIRRDIAVHTLADRLGADDVEQLWTSEPELRTLRSDGGAFGAHKRLTGAVRPTGARSRRSTPS